MKIVIDIDEYLYKTIKTLGLVVEDGDAIAVSEAIANGTPLPKGHGVLKDVTNLMRGLYTDMQTVEVTFTSSDVYKMINEECPTIIEAEER